MFGRKQTPLSRTLAQRVHRIATAPAAAAPPRASRTFGKRASRLPGSRRPGTITFQTGKTIDVVVTDICATGAEIEFAPDVRLPDRVQLAALGNSRWAYVTSETRGAAGLKFVGERNR
jgi:hypothetical protein